MVIAPPPTSLPDLEAYFTTLSGREVKWFKDGANVDLLAPNFLNYFFWKSEASKSTLAPFLKKLLSFISFLSPLSIKKVLVLFSLDWGDKYFKINISIWLLKVKFPIPWNWK